MHWTTRFSTARRALLALAFLGLAAGAHAQDYPSKPIRLVIPYAPGGATDILGRSIAQKLGELLGQPVIVENKGGAGGNIGADLVAKAAPDGYTLLMGTIGTHAINPSLYQKMPFDPVRDFVPVSLVLTNQLVLLVNPGVPVKTVGELVTYSQQPGVDLYFGSAGNGSSHHLSGELLKARSGLKMTHVPYKGSGPAVADLMAGQIQVLFSDIAGALPYTQSGKLRPLAVGGSSRSALMPALPTVAEALNLPGFDVSAWMGIFVPAGTPQPIVARLNKAIVQITRMPDVIEKFAALGAEPIGSTPEEFASHIQAELVKWQKIVSDAHVTIN